jgi:hypothetical protein
VRSPFGQRTSFLTFIVGAIHADLECQFNDRLLKIPISLTNQPLRNALCAGSAPPAFHPGLTLKNNPECEKSPRSSVSRGTTFVDFTDSTGFPVIWEHAVGRSRTSRVKSYRENVFLGALEAGGDGVKTGPEMARIPSI